MNIQRIVRHYAVKFRKENKKVNPHRYTPVASQVSKSKKFDRWTKELIEINAIYSRAYNYALRKGIDMSQDIHLNQINY